MARDQSDSQIPPKAKARIVNANAPRMNQTEQAYAHLLDVRKTMGEVHAYGFETIRFRLAGLCFYTPDFFVVLPDGSIEIHEVKGTRSGKRGNQQEDARVKIKVAAVMYPWFRFMIMAHYDGQWHREEFKP